MKTKLAVNISQLRKAFSAHRSLKLKRGLNDFYTGLEKYKGGEPRIGYGLIPKPGVKSGTTENVEKILTGNEADLKPHQIIH
jgi:hypothetical protein